MREAGSNGDADQGQAMYEAFMSGDQMTKLYAKWEVPPPIGEQINIRFAQVVEAVYRISNISEDEVQELLAQRELLTAILKNQPF